MDVDLARGPRNLYADRPGRCAIGDKNLVGADDEGRAVSDSGSDRPAYSVEDQWLERWAFGTSPNGLALSDDYFWSLTHREIKALRKVWSLRHEHLEAMFFQIRADIHNGWMPREDSRPWTVEDFDGKVRDPRARRMTKEQTKRYFQNRFRKKGDKSALDGLKGQPLPIPIDRKRG